ncbi:16S rRNA (uracil(1498)-N(3))-methyltransferase [Thermanaeromonas sp. C210]|uniref:16S rRNA (uracil(1498)-N(3))-methyltransferase n=1 Tax=Thermanaeromonas sp. C210 TaxID=2731925 RepID=UPI00155C4C22|nr:16S rRNA (uracil(1498)-N(3))-methyltransferase [Thermanaeromonas sp. C210]GFN22521.1 ribosomal RNA small subunit methyltransferase E [Thermanaeromonas sp. C210]
MAHHFFIPPEELRQKRIVLSGETGHHASRVLRLNIGEEISVADGRGTSFKARVVAVRPGEVVAELLEPLPSNDPPLSITLLQGLPKGDKMELIIEKATELGVSRIVGLLTERVIIKLDEEAAARKKDRWCKVARAAARQSRRASIPLVEGPCSLEEALNGMAPETLLLVPWEEERQRGLKEALSAVDFSRPLAILVGPEGGLTPAEVDRARRAGGIVVGLGPRILRTETAGLACLAVLMYEGGDLGGRRYSSG